jgi:hypothetical protein
VTPALAKARLRQYPGRAHKDRRQMGKRYWFPAKRYGWGWGPPSAWQGWVVMAVFVILVLAGVLLFPPRESAPRFVGYVLGLAVALTGVCWWKGEPPRWRWGDDGR